VNALSFEDQVGQLIIALWPGDPEETAAQVAQGHVGGLLLPPGAAAAEGELAEALGRLQRLATYPLLCLGDAEGGLGPLVPGALALAAARRPDLARRAGALAAVEARARGLQLVLAPPFDVQRSPGAAPLAGPSFGDNPSLVARLAAAFVEGCQAAGALAVGRSFPGCGGAVYDATNGRTVLPQDRATLEKIDLLPYVAACRAGLGAVMTGHLHVAALDHLPSRLATHSSAVVEGLLRGSLHFAGLLLSDNLDAPDIRAHYGPAEAAVLAFAAGHDMLVTERPGEVYRALYEVLLNGDIPAARLQEATARIDAARAWLRERELPSPKDLASLENELSQGPTLAREVAASSLTLLRGRPDLLARPGLLIVTHQMARPDGSRVDDDLQRLAMAADGKPAFHALDAHAAQEQAGGVIDAARTAGAALLLLDLPPGAEERGTLREGIIALAQALKRTGLPVGVVLMGDPYPLARFGEADLLLYAPGDTPAHLEAVFAFLRGEAEAPGRLPVIVPGLA